MHFITISDVVPTLCLICRPETGAGAQSRNEFYNRVIMWRPNLGAKRIALPIAGEVS